MAKDLVVGWMRENKMRLRDLLDWVAKYKTVPLMIIWN